MNIATAARIPIDGAPGGSSVQAGAVGAAAGLALHLLLSLVVLQGQEVRPRPQKPATCKKSNPARETGGAGQRATPSVSVVPAAAVVRG